MNAPVKIKRGLKQTPEEVAYWQGVREEMSREYQRHQAELRAAKPDPNYVPQTRDRLALDYRDERNNDWTR